MKIGHNISNCPVDCSFGDLKKITPLWQVTFFQRMVHLFSYDKQNHKKEQDLEIKILFWK